MVMRNHFAQYDCAACWECSVHVGIRTRSAHFPCATGPALLHRRRRARLLNVITNELQSTNATVQFAS
jgi:predicted RNA-binding Zn-ribbon protein involved in translation (DUF1610 family)